MRQHVVRRTINNPHSPLSGRRKVLCPTIRKRDHNRPPNDVCKSRPHQINKTIGRMVFSRSGSLREVGETKEGNKVSPEPESGWMNCGAAVMTFFFSTESMACGWIFLQFIIHALEWPVLGNMSFFKYPPAKPSPSLVV
ncbi:hypothetical protein CEXT_592681 [Caerostris extrusa]|uniref:Uncharacterized protein n=1 Tax=Caerostris extrusa TaxID=172846 RepID=A0AAV4YA49_CAEEX|nr:hypothetical protein CEXT_592681 [Caerostris extrusa]